MLTNDDKRMGTAYHEAGHAVACCHLGKPFESVSIKGGSEFVEPSKRFPKSVSVPRESQIGLVDQVIFQHITMLLCGLVAESIYLHQLEWMENEKACESILLSFFISELNGLIYEVIEGGKDDIFKSLEFIKETEKGKELLHKCGKDEVLRNKSLLSILAVMVLKTKEFIVDYWTDIESIVPELLEKERLTEQEVKNLIQQASQHGS